jgi:chromosome partitioning protein
MAARPTRVIAIANQKGGVGKTTTAVNLAASIAVAEKRTLLIDFDPQGNASSGFGIRAPSVERSVYDCLIGQASLRDVMLPTEIGHLSVVPASANLAGAELELVELEDRALRLKGLIDAFLQGKPRYDYIFIDCPPTLNLLTINALVAAERVLVPLQCEYYALEGLSQLIDTIQRVQETLNPKLEIDGIALTMYDPRNNLALQVAEEVKKHFRVYSSVIPRNVRLSEAPSHGKPALLYDVQSRGAQAYLALAREILQSRSLLRMARPPRVALGEGVNTLFRGPRAATVPTPTPAPASTETPSERVVFLCPIEQVFPRDGQPRQFFDPERMAELTASIKDRGLIEPIVVRRLAADRYEIVAGERRWRACKEAGLREIQVIVKDLNASEAFELALIENIQREDLNAIELAEAYQRLVHEFGYTHDQLAELVRKSRAAISNTMRLLRLPARVRDLVLKGELTEGHARPLLGLDDDEQIERAAESIHRDKLTVRQAEALVQSLKPPPPPEKPEKPARPKDSSTVNLRDLEEALSRHLSAKVQVRKRSNDKGSIVIAYNTLDELDRILLQIRG